MTSTDTPRRSVAKTTAVVAGYGPVTSEAPPVQAIRHQRHQIDELLAGFGKYGVAAPAAVRRVLDLIDATAAALTPPEAVAEWIDRQDLGKLDAAKVVSFLRDHAAA